MSDLRPFINSGYETSTWYAHQIFDGVADNIVMGVTNYVVPKIGDFVVEMSGSTIVRSRVISIPNNIAVLERVYEDVTNDAISDFTLADLTSTSMILVRNTLTPVLAAIHIGLPIESDTFIAYAKVFSGRDINDTDAIVSRRYDGDGIVLDDKVTVTADPINQFVYHASVFNMDRILEDKSSGVIVFYGADDVPLRKYTIVFRESDALVNYSNTDLFISDIVLESIQISPTNAREILVERGFLNNSFNPRVYKVFNTGQREEISLTSRSLVLEGWGNYIFGEENDTFPLTVLYTLASNEVSDMVSNQNGSVVSSAYTIRVVDDAESTNYKLYPVLTWNGTTDVYDVKYIMYDSTYKTNIDVTTKIDISSEFEGYNFDDKQVFNFSVNLQSAGITVDEQYARGSFAIRLHSAPMDKITPFEIFFVPTDNVRYYGAELRTRLTYDVGVYSVSIDSDYTSFEEWLDNVYYKLLPTYDSNTNAQAPQPTHCDVYINGAYVTIEVTSQWNIGVRWNSEIPTGPNTASLQWYSFNADGDRNYLAFSTMQLEIV